MELFTKSAAELAKLLKKKEISSRELTESVLKRMDEKEPSINAYISKTKEIALKQADEADRRIRDGEAVSPLNGIPVAVKDNLCTQGIKNNMCLKILENYIPTI
jgi:aspartyl-tRNA(Asn)/glutamyl-tRNA(Gln) amidotransferase subunit A